MSILNIQTAPPTGQAAVTSSVQSTQSSLPSFIYILTNDTYATVTTTGYLTTYKQQGFTFSNNQMALVYTTDDGPVLLKVVITYSGATILNTVVSLIQISSPGDVVLPTIANHLIVSTDSSGTLGNLTGTAINDGSIQAGRSTIAGTFISFPSSAANGTLILAAANAGGAFNTTISNGTTGQSQVISIPDSGATTANFIISKFATTQHITVGALQVDAGVISSGISTGGTAGGFIAYPATTTNGSLRLVPVGNVGNFATSISDVTALGQAQVITIPDVGAATGQFLVKSAALVSGNVIVASGTAGKVADGGFAVKANTTAAYGGGGTSNAFTATGLGTTSIVTASILTSTNSVSITKVAPTANTLTITFSADPGAATTVSYHAITPAV